MSVLGIDKAVPYFWVMEGTWLYRVNARSPGLDKLHKGIIWWAEHVGIKFKRGDSLNFARAYYAMLSIIIKGPADNLQIRGKSKDEVRRWIHELAAWMNGGALDGRWVTKQSSLRLGKGKKVAEQEKEDRKKKEAKAKKQKKKSTNSKSESLLLLSEIITRRRRGGANGDHLALEDLDARAPGLPSIIRHYLGTAAPEALFFFGSWLLMQSYREVCALFGSSFEISQPSAMVPPSAQAQLGPSRPQSFTVAVPDSWVPPAVAIHLLPSPDTFGNNDIDFENTEARREWTTSQFQPPAPTPPSSQAQPPPLGPIMNMTSVGIIGAVLGVPSTIHAELLAHVRIALQEEMDRITLEAFSTTLSIIQEVTRHHGTEAISRMRNIGSVRGETLSQEWAYGWLRNTIAAMDGSMRRGAIAIVGQEGQRWGRTLRLAARRSLEDSSNAAQDNIERVVTDGTTRLSQNMTMGWLAISVMFMGLCLRLQRHNLLPGWMASLLGRLRGNWGRTHMAGRARDQAIRRLENTLARLEERQNSPPINWRPAPASTQS